MNDWYDQIEEPVRDLVRILRNNGFNTICSCGHLPKPYVQIIQQNDEEVTKLYNLLVESHYENFSIHSYWEYIKDESFTHSFNQRTLEVSFHIKMPLASFNIKKKEEKA